VLKNLHIFRGFNLNFAVWITDNANELSGKQMKQAYYDKFARELRTISVRHPQSNGKVEKFNGFAKEMIARVIESGDPKNWPLACPDIMVAHNSTHSGKLGISPHEIGTTRKPRLPREILAEAGLMEIVISSDGQEVEITPDTGGLVCINDAKKYFEAACELRGIILSKVFDKRKRIQEKYKARHDAKLKESPSTIHAGDFVLKQIPKNKRARRGKNRAGPHPQFDGPYFVQAITASGACTLRNVITSTDPPKVLGHHSKKKYKAKDLKVDTRYEPQLGAINEDGHDILCPACGSQQRSLNGLHLHLSKCPTLDLDLTGLGSAEACIQLAIFLSLQENGHPDDVERVDLNQRVAEYGLKFPPPGAITTKGNCFFDSVALQQFLLHGKGDMGEWLQQREILSHEARQKVCDWLEANERFELHWMDGVGLCELIPIDTNWQDWVQDMRKDKEWAQLPCLIGAAEVYRCKISVIDNVAGAAGGKRDITPSATLSTHLQVSMWFSMEYENHYTSLHEPNDLLALKEIKKYGNKKIKKRKRIVMSSSESEDGDKLPDTVGSDSADVYAVIIDLSGEVTEAAGNVGEGDDDKTPIKLKINFAKLQVNDAPYIDDLFIVAIREIWDFRAHDRWKTPKSGFSRPLSVRDTQLRCIELGKSIAASGQEEAITLACSQEKSWGQKWWGQVDEGNHRLVGMVHAGLTHVVARIAMGGIGSKHVKARFPGRFKYPKRIQGRVIRTKPTAKDLGLNALAVPWPVEDADDEESDEEEIDDEKGDEASDEEVMELTWSSDDEKDDETSNSSEDEPESSH
jgi:hypothetical protein